jgi:hypothetical protein
MATFKEIAPSDQQTRSTTLNQLVDIIQEDVSGSATRRAYQVFVTGGVGPGVTSSLYQTVHDQDFSLQTSNPIFDITVGTSRVSQVVTTALVREDTNTGKLFFKSSSLMIREKVDIYRQYAASLLGSADSYFTAPIGNSDAQARIDEAVFLSFKRLFTRDGIKRETFALRLYKSASLAGNSGHVGESRPRWLPGSASLNNYGTNKAFSGINSRLPNIRRTSVSGSDVVTDLGSSTSQRRLFGGEVGELVLASNTANPVGLIFYNAGTVILDAKKVFSGSQFMSGTIAAMNANTSNYVNGKTSGASPGFTVVGGNHGGAINAKFIPDLWASASMDDLIDHIATTRFSSGSLTACTFQNSTNITSKLIFCRAGPDDFNYSSNPTFKDSTGRIRVINAGQEGRERSFTFPTTIGLYNSNHRLLAVAKLSRPVEKNDTKDMTFRIRLDF